MEMSSVRWNSEQVGEECKFMSSMDMDSLHFDALDDFRNEQFIASLHEEDRCYASLLNMDQERSNRSSARIWERPAKQIKTNTWKSSPVKHVVSAKAAAASPSSTCHLISFGNAINSQAENNNSAVTIMPKDELVLSYEDVSQTYNLDSYVHGTKRSSSAMTRTPSHAQEHVMAERKRRERLTERFIALSALVPGLKKLDKASVLGDAINYLKHLQERVNMLEEQMKEKKKKSEESVVSLSNTNKIPAAYDDSSSCDENSGGCVLPAIEARVSDKNVLIRIHCDKQKGFLPKMLNQVEKLHLNVINTSVLPFGDYALDITIVSQMEAEFCLTVNGLVRKLRSALQ